VTENQQYNLTHKRRKRNVPKF